jgi:hypothetical protein
VARRKRSRIDALLEQQAYDLERLHAHELAAVLRAYDDARRSMLERLQRSTGLTPETDQHLRMMLLQAEQGAADLRARMGAALAGTELRAHEASMRHLMALVKLAEPEFIGTGAAVEVEIVRRLAGKRALALHRYSVERYGAQVVEDIQRALVAGVVEGLTTTQLAQRVAGAGGSTMASQRHRAMLIARMETTRAYNDAHLESIRVTNEMDRRPEDPMLKRIDEFFDQRNHPFSRAAHGTLAKADELFTVPVAAVAAAAQSMSKGMGGIVWTQTGSVYQGMNLPAHFNERGRITAWRASWGTPPS